jgi:nitrogen fixation NifU-like protein
MDDLYRDEILEHYRRPHNFGTLDEPDAVQEGSNPLCGDRITLMLELSSDGRVTDVAFTGRGCAISQASASMLTDAIRGKRVDELTRLDGDAVIGMLGIEISPARLKCALLSLDTLHKALQGRGTPEPAVSPVGAREVRA